MKQKFLSRRFQLSCFFAIIGAIGLFTGHVADTQFIALSGLVLGLYAGFDTMEKVKQNESKKTDT